VCVCVSQAASLDEMNALSVRGKDILPHTDQEDNYWRDLRDVKCSCA